MEVLTKEQTIELIREYYTPPLMNRKKAADYLSMSIRSFDNFVAANPHLKLRTNGSSPKYCPKQLRNAFN